MTNLANGLITGPAGGISAGTVTVKGNDGTIEAANIPGVTTATGGVAIKAAGDADITNSKIIQATETGGIAIKAGGTATIQANGGTITGDVNAITAQTVTVKGNAGTIEATAKSAGAVNASAINGETVTVTNSGTIRDNGATGLAIRALAGAATITVNNLAGGSVIADGSNGTAIGAGNAVNVTNAGASVPPGMAAMLLPPMAQPP